MRAAVSGSRRAPEASVAITRETLRLVREMRTAVDRIVDQITRGLTASWVAAWDDLLPAWFEAVLELITTTPPGVWPGRAQVLRAHRIQLAVEQAAQSLRNLVDTVRRQVPEAARQAADIGYTGQRDIILSQLPYGSTAAFAVRYRRHLPDAIDAIVRRTAEQVTAVTWPLEPDATEAMKRELIRGVVVGDNPKEAARLMVRRVEGRFNGGLARAVNIARTEILDAHRQAATIGQEEHADVLEGWVWTARLDTRVCASCLVKHGTVYPLSMPGPLDHQSGRCARTPKTKSWRELGIDLPEPEDVIPDAREWFNALPREDKLAILGPTRLKLLEDGEITWEDLSTMRTTSGWRPSYVVTPVGDLVARR